MYRQQAIIRGVLLAVLAFAIPLTPHAKAIKCWTNSDGNKECGDAVPAEYVQQGHQEISQDGRMIIREHNRAKSDEELAEQELLAKLKAEQQQLARQQAARDRVLLETFTNEEDMVLARDDKLSTIESQIRLTENHINKLHTTLEKMIKMAADLERGGKRPSPSLIEDIEKVRRQISENWMFIESQRTFS